MYAQFRHLKQVAPYHMARVAEKAGICSVNSVFMSRRVAVVLVCMCGGLAVMSWKVGIVVLCMRGGRAVMSWKDLRVVLSSVAPSRRNLPDEADMRGMVMQYCQISPTGWRHRASRVQAL